jgi:hypothetical protein
MDPMYYFITFACVAGSAYTSFALGKRYGIEKFIEFLEMHTNSKNIIKLKITEQSVDFIK